MSRFFLYIQAFIFFMGSAYSKDLIDSFVATYIKEQKFSFSKYPVKSEGFIMFSPNKIILSEDDGRVRSSLKISGKKGTLETTTNSSKNIQKIDVSRVKNSIFDILNMKALEYSLKKGLFIYYYFKDKNYKFVILKKNLKNNKISSIEYKDSNDTKVKIKMLWFRFLEV